MVDLSQSLFTGFFQGITEFLPVSSSGHLFLLRNLLSLDFSVSYVVLLHLGTLVAVCLFLGKDLLHILKGLWKRDFVSWKLFFALLVGTIPAGVVGVWMQDFLDTHLTGYLTIGVSLLLTGLILFLVDRKETGTKRLADVGIRVALVVGLFQAAALVPGISRSGITLAGALLMGLQREDAFRFSFLLSIPVILGGSLLEARHGLELAQGWPGFVVAMFTGIGALWLLRWVTVHRKLRWFAYYCWGAGIVCFFL
ncbi:MAG TPA: undecaprenyl-diphosphate phosphatase [Thermotogota bacterium]|nr:undecaprenyl-diphosphate phosphatase [Thermotogota bacterium]HRW91938.1 undecaprenyl-diphosphate phosphatase [Thermotogota bacterium]